MPSRDDFIEQLIRYVDSAIDRRLARLTTPRENYGEWFLKVRDAAGTPVSEIGVEEIIFDAGAVTKPAPGKVRIAGGGGGFGGYNWGVVSRDLFTTGTLALRHPVVAAGSLSTAHWTAYNGLDIQVTLYVNATPIATHTISATGYGSGAASTGVAVGDVLSVVVSSFTASGDLALTWT